MINSLCPGDHAFWTADQVQVKHLREKDEDFWCILTALGHKLSSNLAVRVLRDTRDL